MHLRLCVRFVQRALAVHVMSIGVGAGKLNWRINSRRRRISTWSIISSFFPFSLSVSYFFFLLFVYYLRRTHERLHFASVDVGGKEGLKYPTNTRTRDIRIGFLKRYFFFQELLEAARRCSASRLSRKYLDYQLGRRFLVLTNLVWFSPGISCPWDISRWKCGATLPLYSPEISKCSSARVARISPISLSRSEIYSQVSRQNAQRNYTGEHERIPLYPCKRWNDLGERCSASLTQELGEETVGTRRGEYRLQLANE